MSSVPPQVSPIYDKLREEVIWLHGRWVCYRQLFAASPKRIEMLNECASAFFFIIQDVLFDEIQVSLCKLTDSAKTGKYENLSLEQLQSRLEKYGDTALAASNRIILDRIRSQCAPFREWRNKQLTHLDLQTSMKTSPIPLPGISREIIEQALSSLREYLNEIERHYNNSEFGYQHFIMQNDGEALLTTIRAGLRYEELLQEGKISWDDWHHGKWHDA